MLFMFLYINTADVFSLRILVMFDSFNYAILPIFKSVISDYVSKGSTTARSALLRNLGGTGGQANGPLASRLLTGSAYTKIPLIFEILFIFPLQCNYGNDAPRDCLGSARCPCLTESDII